MDVNIINIIIREAEYDDLEEILQLQYLAYQTEAARFETDDIQPLKQSLEELIEEYNQGIILKMISEDNTIIGSIRAREENGTVYIGKLMVHPNYRRQGYGTKLLIEIEEYFPKKRYELFTSTRSIDNIHLYKKNGYREFSQRQINDEIIFVYMEKE